MHFEVRVALAEPSAGDAATHWFDVFSLEIFEAGLGGFEDRDDDPERRTLVFYADSPEQAAQCAGRLRAILAKLRNAAPRIAATLEIAPVDFPWSTAWMEFLRPVDVTTTITVCPLQHDRGPDVAPATPPAVDLRGRRRLYLQPSMSFGVGSHATTQLCAQAVERFCVGRPRARMLDVGTGTGVLSLIALMNGAHFATGIDIDTVAVESARINAQLNAMAASCHFSAEPLERIAGAFDLVAANLDVATLEALTQDLLARLDRRGTLLVSGVLREHHESVRRTFERHGAVVRNTEHLDDWALLELGHRDA